MKDAFREKINDIKAPDSLVQDTLKKMLEENERLQGKHSAAASVSASHAAGHLAFDRPAAIANSVQPDARKLAMRKSPFLRMARVIAPLAACLCLAILGIHFSNTANAVQWMEIDINSLPAMNEPARGNADDAQDLAAYEAENSIQTASLLPSYSLAEAAITRVSLPQTGEIGFMAEILYLQDESQVVLKIYPFTHILEAVLTDGGKPHSAENVDIYFGYDQLMDMRLAAWEVRGLHFCLESASVSENEFVTLTGQIVANILA